MTRPIIKVLIADDQEIAREGYRRVLETQPELEVIAVAADGLEAVQLAEAQCPQVVLLDIRMPHLNGIEAAPAQPGDYYYRHQNGLEPAQIEKLAWI